MLEPLAERALLDPAGVALVDGAGGAALTWAELDVRVAVHAGRLRALGAGRGDRVAVVAPAGVDLVTTLHACLRLGAVLVPHSPRAPAVALAPELADCAPRLVLTDAASLAVVSEACAGALAPALATFDKAGASVPWIGDIVADPVATGGTGDGDDACIIYTSGSAGRPKGVRLTLANLGASSAGCAESLGGIDTTDRWLLALGAHRVGGLSILVRSALTGAAVVTVARFDEAGTLAALGRGASLVSLVPTMLQRLIDAGGLDALRVPRAILLGGAPAPGERVRAWAAAGLRVCPTYGLSETSSQVCTVPPGRAAELAGTVGFTHSQARVAIEPDRGGPPLQGPGPAGGAGEIVVEGPVVAAGYVSSGGGGTRFSGSGAARRFRTGDLGNLDSRGALVVHGRMDLTILTGGEKVSPEEVEAVLTAHPGVRDAAVRGVPDALYGAVVEAMVVGDVDAGALRRWCDERLPPHKVPRRYRRVDALPRTADGKLLRRELEA